MTDEELDRIAESIRNPVKAQLDPAYNWLTIEQAAERTRGKMSVARIYQALRDHEITLPIDTTHGTILIGVPKPKPPVPEAPRPKPPSNGVYFLACNGFIKIGMASNVHERVSALRKSFPFEMVPIGFIWTDCTEAAFEAERLWHASFSEIRYKGEWFQDVPELRAAIAEYAKPWPARKRLDAA